MEEHYLLLCVALILLGQDASKRTSTMDTCYFTQETIAQSNNLCLCVSLISLVSFTMCIRATTLDEYRKHIKKDPALKRRFQPIKVLEPSVEKTINILKGLRELYEIHHKLRYIDDVVVVAAELSHQYI
ncbi:chaperone protein ClpC chloroplastic-like protein, partial [Tanacetum coccineum]